MCVISDARVIKLSWVQFNQYNKQREDIKVCFMATDMYSCPILYSWNIILTGHFICYKTEKHSVKLYHVKLY